MNIFKPVRDFFDMQLEDQGSFIAVAKTVWDKCPMWVKSLVVATKLTLLTVAFFAIAIAIFSTTAVVLFVIMGMWWIIHQMIPKGISKTLSQLWAILVTTDTVKVKVVETPGDGEQDAGFHKKAGTK